MAEIAEAPATAPEIDANAQAPETEKPITREEYEQAKADLRKANAESAARRKELEKYQQAEAAKAEAEMTASQKAEARAEAAEKKALEAEAKYNTELLRNAFVSASQKAEYGADGKSTIADWEAAFILIKADPANADLDPSGVVDALKAASKKYPLLIGKAVQGAPPATPPESESNLTTAEKQRQREEYERRVRQNKP